MQVSEESLVDILARYERKGYDGQFSARPAGMVLCHLCRDETPADQVPLEALHRLEGASDPEDMMAVAAIECPACGAAGTLVLPYGTGAGADDAEVLRNLLDDRDHSGIQSGV